MTRLVTRVTLAALSLSLCACGHAPAFNILGSYFPAWMLCGLIGIVLSVVFHFIVVRLHLEDYVRPTVLTYPCAIACFTFTLWLVLFQ